MSAVGADQHQDLRALAASALSWWADAGVDVLVADEPRDWLAKAPPAPAPLPAAPAAPTLPETLEAFVAWRLSDTAPEARAPGPRIVAEGPDLCALMAVVDCPDGDTILAPAAARLFARMLAAIGHAPAKVRLATLAAAKPLGGRLSPEREAELAPLLRHHVGLVAPDRLLVMGVAASRALLGADGAAKRGSLQRVNLNGATIDAVAILSPATLLEQPRGKAEAWRGLQCLIRGKA